MECESRMGDHKVCMITSGVQKDLRSVKPNAGQCQTHQQHSRRSNLQCASHRPVPPACGSTASTACKSQALPWHLHCLWLAPWPLPSCCALQFDVGTSLHEDWTPGRTPGPSGWPDAAALHINAAWILQWSLEAGARLLWSGGPSCLANSLPAALQPACGSPDRARSDNGHPVS